MRLILTLFLTFCAAATAAQCAPTYVAQTESYTFSGRVKARAELSIDVEKDGKVRSFRLDEIKLPAHVKPGARVVVQYAPTMDADVFQATKVVVWPLWKPLPADANPPE
jgi:hypothetical protein